MDAQAVPESGGTVERNADGSPRIIIPFFHFLTILVTGDQCHLMPLFPIRMSQMIDDDCRAAAGRWKGIIVEEDDVQAGRSIAALVQTRTFR